MAACTICGTENLIGHLDITNEIHCAECGSVLTWKDVMNTINTYSLKFNPISCDDCGKSMTKVVDDVYECVRCYIVAVIEKDDIEEFELVAA